MGLFETGVRPHVDVYLQKKSEERRDYGDYWSASSAGYCMRKVIFDRLGVPHVTEDNRKTRVFESGHIFHEWIQRITKDAGLSVAQELELQDEDLMIRGHIDDLVLVKRKEYQLGRYSPDMDPMDTDDLFEEEDHLILYDYKTQHSRAFQWAKKNGRTMSHYHKMQLGTYMYMLRNFETKRMLTTVGAGRERIERPYEDLTEARILKISKDDLCMSEEQLLWDDRLEKDVVDYWRTLNEYWANKQVPKCTCADYEGGFMAREAYNPYFYNDEPCSLEWLKLKKQEGSVTW